MLGWVPVCPSHWQTIAPLAIYSKSNYKLKAKTHGYHVEKAGLDPNLSKPLVNYKKHTKYTQIRISN